MPKVADVIAERYELLAHLGDGGTASVWQARDRTLERDVAIKFLYVADERDLDVLRKQFLREARIACAVKHRNVIQTMDFGQTDEGRAYMVMELLHGEELTERIGTETGFSIAEVIQIGMGILRGLQAIHEAGIVHRDLKPENIYLERDQDGLFPKILDFGIAKSIDRGNRRSVLTTKEGIVVGTPEYMSPEQARGQRDMDARADVWSVGVILFELLTGKLPFDEPSEAEVIIKIVTTDAPDVATLNASVPSALCAVVAKALQRDRSQRFQSAAEMHEALLDAAKMPSEDERRAALGLDRKRRRLAFALGAAGVGLVALLGLLSRAQPPRALPSPGPEKPKTVTVSLHGVPDSASVLVNGRPLKGPTLTLPNDGHSRLIEVQAAGRAPWRVMHPAGNDADYEVRLPLLAAPPAPPAAQPTNAPVQSARAPRVSTAPRVVHPPPEPKPAAAASEPAPASEHRTGKGPAVWRKLDF